MPTNLGRPFMPVITRIPPHMSPEDIVIYRRWAISGLKNALRQYFDVSLGLIDVPDSTASPEIKAMWVRLNQKRVDAIIEYEDHIKLIEFRHNATPNAIGRVLAYKMLWKDDPVIPKPFKMAIVSNRYDKEVDRLSIAMDIIYEVV